MALVVTESKLTTVASTSASLPSEVCVFPSALGWMALRTHGDRVSRLAFGQRSAAAARKAVAEEAGQSTNEPEAGAAPLDVEELVDRLRRFATGEVVHFDDIAVDESYLTPFGGQVVQACRALRWGETASYGELASRCGRSGAARAVGSVMARNRVPLIVPCHRVLGAGGSLGGYSAPGGLATKRQLLSAEADG